MDEIQAERRGEDARALLSNELFKEAWAALREQLTRRLETEELSVEQRMELVNLLRANRKAKIYLEQVLVTGTFAAQDIERKRSLLDRIKRRA